MSLKWATVTCDDAEKQIYLCIRDNRPVTIDEIASEVNVGRGKNRRKNNFIPSWNVLFWYDREIYGPAG